MIDVELSAEKLAPLLVGALLRDGEITVRLTEVEAYSGQDDPASHAWRGPRPVNLALFGDPGTLYCYRSHGLHICGNLVCGRPGVARQCCSGPVRWWPASRSRVGGVRG